MSERNSMSGRANRVVLIQPPASFFSQGKPVLHTGFESIGLLSLAGYLESKGVATSVFHFARAHAAGMSLDALLDRVVALDPVLVGISINWLHLSEGALETARALKQRSPKLPVVVGGQHASFFASDIVRAHADVFDGVVVGEGEETLLETVERAAAGRDLSKIDGLMTPSQGQEGFRPRSIGIHPDDLPLMRYAGVFPPPAGRGPERHLAALDTTRGGCHRDCNYCLESRSLGSFGREGPSRYSVNRLVDQVESFVAEGRDWITIQDQFFIHGDEVLTAFVDRLNERKVKLTHLSLFVEPGSFSKEALAHLERAPAEELALSYGVETGSRKVARNLGRFDDFQALLQELTYVAQKRFVVSTWWMVGLPGEGAAEVEETKALIIETMKLGIHPKWVTPLILFPRTALARSCPRFGMRPLLSTFDDFRRFSVATANTYGLYPELITHESDLQPKADTLRYVRELKETIEQNLALVEEKIRDKPDFTRFSSYKKGSFF